MHIVEAEYVGSFVSEAKCPKEDKPEFAFIGRSNVGKSSLINYLCDRKALTKVSKTPGKTQTINFFNINHRFHLVDLPGYGFAKISREQRNKWEGMIKTYLENRKQLQYVFQLIDSRIPPQQNDLDFADWLGEKRVPFVQVFTKGDKPGSKETLSNVAIFKNEMLKKWAALPPSFITSAEKRNGREEIWEFMREAIDEWNRRALLAEE